MPPDITDAGPRLRAMNDALERDFLRLTQSERWLLEMLADHPSTHQIMPHEVATMRGLLERSQFGICEQSEDVEK